MSMDGGVGPDTKVESVEELLPDKSGTPLKVVIWYDPQTNECCPGLSVNQNLDVHPVFDSKITDKVPGPYTYFPIDNRVSIGASYGDGSSLGRPGTRNQFFAGTDYRETLLILKSIRY